MKNFQIKNSTWGKGLFAIQDISQGDFIIEWNDGTSEVYTLENIKDLPSHAKDHAVQFGENLWIDHKDGRNINHSCAPNCGWRGLSTLVAMRDIKNGEELFLDYSTMEDSEWEMPRTCECGSLNCRKKIGGFRFLNKETVGEYMKGKYISEWLVKKYNLY